MPPFPPIQGIASLAISPLTGSIFAASNDVLRSDDNGESWVSTGFSSLNASGGDVIAIRPDGTVFVTTGSFGPIYRSTDNGNSWTALRNGLPPNIVVISLAVDSLGQIYAGMWGEDAIYRSSDNGETWVRLGLPGYYAMALAVDPRDHIFVATNWGPFFRSVDGGNTWDELASPNPSAGMWSFAFGADGKVFAGTHSYWLVEGLGIYRSEDDGQTWSYLGPRNVDITTLAVNPLGHVFAGTGGDGVYRSTNGGDTWARVTHGMKATEAYSLLFNANNELLAAAHDAGIHKSDDRGQTWSLLEPRLFLMNWPGWPGRFSSVLAMTSTGVIFYAWGRDYDWRGGVARSRDNGNTWEESVGPLVYKVALGIAIDRRDYIYASFSAGQDDGIYRSTDGGDSWEPLGLQRHAIYSIAVTPAGTILASGYGYDPEISGLFRSTDDGKTWAHVGFSGEEMEDITVSPNGHVFLASNVTGINRSTDDGQTWVRLDMPGGYPIAINSEGRIFVGYGGQGFFSSTDDGTTWTYYSDPSLGCVLWSFAFDSDGYLYAGTWGGGVWRSTETTFLVKPGSLPLHGSGGTANPPKLFLDAATPTATTAKYTDSAGIKFSAGNAWRQIGTWTAAPALTTGTLASLNELRGWLGLKNSDDQGTRFDLRAEVRKNGVPIALGETYCIDGVTRNPDKAKEVAVPFASFPAAPFDGATDVLSLAVFTRIGTDGAGNFCGGHSNAVGLRLYFDAVSRPSRFGATF
jgi:photosystem II stability/assembly factor-like uncharacterized protein